ncbi:unnamed protein product [Symbiodinium natans]|uniref:PPPDE domain-containing protein n=1 Tax=Symbiodinium natans TaxID=878477 RepID=A0A812T4P2_9DINO|nr:unnamed protein product [Symbiodinium natans]
MGGQQSAAKDAAGQPPGGDATSSSHGKGRAANNQVQLAVSPLGGVPGATAYHSSVVVNGDEYFFSDGGISFGSGLLSHKNPQNPDSKPEVFDMGMSPYTGTQMKAALERFFHSGTYDLLRKNCNSFSDCALFYLLHRRLDKKYRAMEKLGAFHLPMIFAHTISMLQQRSVSASKLESMKQEAEMAKEWGKQVKADLYHQQGNAKALNKDTLASRSWGGPKYRHVPPHEGQSAEYQKSMRNMQSVASEIAAKQATVDKAMQDDYRMVRNTRADTSVHSLGAWLEKYGKPTRQPEQQERFRTVPFKQRRIPFLGVSEAKTLRLGAGIWAQRSETDLLGTYNFRSVGRCMRHDKQTHGCMKKLRRRFSILILCDCDVFSAKGCRIESPPHRQQQQQEQGRVPYFYRRRVLASEFAHLVYLAGASAMGIVQAASGGQYQPNPKAEGFDVEKVCEEIDPDKVWKTPGQATGGSTVTSAEAMRAARLARLGGGAAPGGPAGPGGPGGSAGGYGEGASPPPSAPS